MSQSIELPTPFFVLAPMDDVTDIVFRQIIADCAKPDLFVTEFVNVDGLQSPGRDRLLPKLKFGEKDQPIIAQIWGKTPENYRKTAAELVDMGFAGVDINMGCPDRNIVKNGSCAAFINNRELALEVIQAVREGVAGRVPISVKTRLGFNDIDLSWHELLLKQGLDMLMVHARTRAQMSKVPANWDKIGEIRELRDRLAPETKIVGNGDVLTRQQGLELAAKYGVDGVMIGRGIFDDPFVFAKYSPWGSYTPDQKVNLYKKHIKLFAQTWLDGERKTDPLKKFCKMYISGFDGASELRTMLMTAKNIKELLSVIENIKPISVSA